MTTIVWVGLVLAIVALGVAWRLMSRRPAEPPAVPANQAPRHAAPRPIEQPAAALAPPDEPAHIEERTVPVEADAEPPWAEPDADPEPESAEDEDPEPTEPPIIAAGVASMSSVASFGASRTKAERLERAMAHAVLVTMAKGVTDPNVIRQAQLDARAACLRDMESAS